MTETEKNLPLEKRFFDVEINGTRKRIAGIDETWLVLKERNFCKYMRHPSDINGRSIEREVWLELTNYIIDDLEWLLQQKHHIFWSFMIFSNSAHELLITFLQEAPPFYMRNEFPKVKEMEMALEKIEHLVFLVFVRLSTEKESETRYIENLGPLLYDNYLFTMPVLLDICLIYGTRYRYHVVKMIRSVILAAPQYLSDLQEVFNHLLHVMSIVRDKFDSNEISMVNTRTVTHLNEIRDFILLLYDSTSTIKLFLDLYSHDFNLVVENESFGIEIASFYSCVIPKIHKCIKSNDCNMFRYWNFREKILDIRLDLLAIVRNTFCITLNEVLHAGEGKEECMNKYLTDMLEILHEPLFLTDYNKIYPIEEDLKTLTELCPHEDSEILRYVSNAISTLKKSEPIKSKESVTDAELQSLKSQVTDLFPDMDDGYVEACIQYYNYNPERVISAILEDNLPKDLCANRNSESILPKPSSSSASEKLKKIEKIKSKNPEMYELMNDKMEVREMKERFARFETVSVDEYDDEYDDTYDGQYLSVPVGDDPDLQRRPFVTPRILRARKNGEDEDEEEENEVVEEKEAEEGKEKLLDQFVPNPAELRAKQEQRRADRGRRNCVGRGRGRGQDKQVLANRDFKNTHKSSTANHNRRKLASRKRNMPLAHS